jgi:hypothetical protein
MGINYKQIKCPWPVDDNSQFDYLWTSTESKHFGFPTTKLSPAFLSWADLKNLHISFAEVFYLPAGCTVRRIHTDLDHITESCSKINFILGGEDAPMQWFALKENAQSHHDVNTAPTVINAKQVSPYLSWPREECIVIDEAILSGANVIHAGIPHVVFTKEKPRIAISVVLQCKVSRVRLSVEEALLRIQN